MGAVRANDGYNWGYDPLHYTTPEGGYAVNPSGAARNAEFKAMVDALHGIGLKVVLDVVYNHTSSPSPLDPIVPGYYHRLSADGTDRDLDLLPQHRHRTHDDGQAGGRLGRHLGLAPTVSTASAST